MLKLLDGPLGLFRNVYKFAPVVLLPVAVGVAAGVDSPHRLGRPRWPRRRRRSWRGVAVVMVALVLLGAWPHPRRGPPEPGAGFEAVPSWWDEAKEYVARTPPAAR